MDVMDLEVSSDTSGLPALTVIEQETYSAADWDVPAPAQDGFDYDLIGDPVVRQEAIEAAERIKGRLRKSLEEYVGIGFDLIKVKDGIGYGNFQRWIDAEFGMTYKTATNYINVATRFGKPEIISCLSGVPPTALIHLASAPESVQEEILEAVASGQRIKVKDVKEAIAKAKAAIPDTEERSEERKLETALKAIDEDIRREARAVADERSAAVSALIGEVVGIVGDIEAAGFQKGCWKRFQAAGKTAGKAIDLLTQACGEELPDDIRLLVAALKRIKSASYTGKPVDHEAAKRCADDLMGVLLGDPNAWDDVDAEHDDHGDPGGPGDVFSDYSPPEFLKHLVDA
ncbi:hypothetical protein [Azospirillum brasilense]|uniref:hypothetical protein n=1 Tax=Azospirillum brasilense TaxID=192 RepID=UPI000E696065|nr:hypothetical protein [Azospirillum brasilense]NUB23329.1 hypothetical protein [Azospirillum brasilense]NUB30951.1 hypothetical protein [Azospirillum brasilense]RIW05666.1 hypothetical protein D2T81_07420 [Azospirillum brasilense]